MSKKLKISFILFIVLIALIAIYFIWQNPFHQKNNIAPSETLITSDLNNLQKIEITKGKDITTLNKQDNVWHVESEDNALANEVIINALISSLQKVKSGTIISDDPAKYPAFNLKDELATNLKLYDDKNNLIIELFIGKLGPTYQQTYVRKKGSKNILLVEQPLPRQINQSDWKKPETNETEENNNQ